MGEWTFQSADGIDHTFSAPSHDDALKAFVNTYGGGGGGQRAPAADDGGGGALDTALGYAKAGVSGVAQGVAGLVGLPGTIGDAGQKIFDNTVGKYAIQPVTDALFGKASPEMQAKINAQLETSPFSGAGLSRGMSAVTGGASDYQPRSKGEEYTQTIGSFLPASYVFGGGGLLNLLRTGVAPAIGSQSLGDLVKGSNLPRPDWMPDWVPSAESAARMVGAIGGGMAGDVATGMITPHPTDPARIAAADAFDNAKVPTPYTAGQKAGSKALMTAEGQSPMATDLMKDQKEAFTQNALDSIGAGDSTRALPSVMKPAINKIKSGFNAVGSANDLIDHPAFTQAMDDVLSDYGDRTDPKDWAPVIKRTYNRAQDLLANNGQISGSEYQDMVTRLRNASKGTSDPSFAKAAYQMRDALDDGMENSIAANNPGDLGKYRLLRSQYRDASAIEDTLANSALGKEGLLDPKALYNQIGLQSGSRAMTQDARPLGEWARHGSLLMDDLPGADTSGGGVMGLLKQMAGGAYAGHELGSMISPAAGYVGAGAGMVGVPVVNAVSKRAAMNPALQWYMKNQWLNDQGPTVARQQMQTMGPLASGGMPTPAAGMVKMNAPRTLRSLPSPQGLMRLLQQQSLANQQGQPQNQ